MRFDVAIVGGGSGGFGAAWAAARLGLRVVIVDRHHRLGGLSTVGGVSCWEPGVGATGAPLDLYRLLRQTPGQVAIYSVGRHFAWPTPSSMEGREWVERGETDGWAECRRRIRAHWHYLQAEHPEFRRYRFWSEALLMGIRETRQISCHRILSEDDLRGGLSRQRDPDVIALADHPLDRHGQGGGCHLLNEPYGIPFRSLIPVGSENMAVACRAAGFDAAAASSVRLSRTVMQMGQAVGTAAALAAQKRRALTDVDAGSLREALRRQGVALEWPPPPAIQQRIAEAG